MFSLVMSLAFAQDYTDAEVPPINAQRFRPTIDGRRTLWTDDSIRGEHKKFTLRPLLHYTDEPLVYQYPDGSTTGLVNSVFQLDLMGGFSYDRLRLGVSLPVYLFSGSDVSGGQTGLGDIAVDAKVTVLDGGDAPLGLALNGRMNLPTASVANSLGAKNTGWELAGILDKEFGKVLLAGNLGVRGAPNTDLENVRIDDFFIFRAAGGYAFTEDAGAALEVSGDVPLVSDASEGMPIEWMLGGYAPLTGPLGIRAGFGTSLTSGVAAPDWRAVLGVTWAPKAEEDRDKDGIVDEVDACPDTAEDMDAESDEDGCPEDIGVVKLKVVDEDGNPVLGASSTIDGTPSKGGDKLRAELESGSYKAMATAEGYEPGEVSFDLVDADQGKVVEIVMTKVAVPMGTLEVVVQDPDGKPVEGAIVRIGREALDGLKTQRAPGEVQVGVRANGFKNPPSQKTLIEDGKVSKLVFVMNPAKAEISGDRIDLRDSVYFDTAKATIQKRSYSLLDDVVEILNDHPELTKIRIEGHTDSRGSAAYNKALSQRRAASVRQWLIDKGIPADRLESEGFGEEKPIDPREVPEAWTKNRRVDFFVAERSD